jgi:glyoxylase-like metal-dependent hydrolase (beta-lactamase superfamily II)
MEVVLRFKVLSCVVALFLAVSQAVVCGADPGLQKISEHIYAYVDVKNASAAGNSFGANAAVVVGSNGALVIDTLVSAKEADRFLKDISEVTEKPVKYVVNTHYHLDHAWGNCQFAKLGALVITHDNARAHMTQSAYLLDHPELLGLTAQDLESTTLVDPAITFTDSMTIDLGDVTVQLDYPGPSHTDDSITAYVPQDKVLFTGDILFTRYHPNLTDGDFTSWQEVLVELEQTPAVKIIPGHGPLSSRADLQDMRTYIHEFDAQARALCQGKRAEDVQGLAEELVKSLPDQQRTELLSLVELNLLLRYLPPAQAQEQAKSTVE